MCERGTGSWPKTKEAAISATAVFPDADLKVLPDRPVQDAARRRAPGSGQRAISPVSSLNLEGQDCTKRDRLDPGSAVAPLAQGDDADRVDRDGLESRRR